MIKRLREHFDVHTMRLEPQDFGRSYLWVENELGMNPYDLILITGDRVEMCAAAAAAFHNKVKIAHFYAGVINDPITTFDDVDRHCITLWSDIIFTESGDALLNAANLVGPIKYANIFPVGISHLDDLEVDESKVPTEPYELFLYNRTPMIERYDAEGCFYFGIELGEAKQKGNTRIQIGGNPDGTSFQYGDIYYENLPRPQFLGLLKNCQRFITNSSAAIYEAPHFLKPEQIVMVGDRNRNRPHGLFKTGASDRIVEILREYLK